MAFLRTKNLKREPCCGGGEDCEAKMDTAAAQNPLAAAVYFYSSVLKALVSYDFSLRFLIAKPGRKKLLLFEVE